MLNCDMPGEESSPMHLFAIGNPNGCVLAFVESLSIHEEVDRTKAFFKWCQNQSSSFEISALEGRLDDTMESASSLLDAILSLLSKIGWQIQLAWPILSGAIESLKKNGLLTFNYNRLGSLTDLGRFLYANGHYNNYLQSFAFKANFLKVSNVLITNKGEDDGVGSGSFIGKHTIITAKHVVEGINGEPKLIGENGKRFTVRNIAPHPNSKVDLAQITTNEPFEFFHFEIEENCTITEKVIVFGYPPIPLASKAFLVANVGEISSLVDSYLDDTDCIILSCITRPGNSGGPILNEYGKLVGIVIQNRQKQLDLKLDDLRNLDVTSGIAYATGIRAKYIHEFDSLA